MIFPSALAIFLVLIYKYEYVYTQTKMVNIVNIIPSSAHYQDHCEHIDKLTLAFNTTLAKQSQCKTENTSLM